MPKAIREATTLAPTTTATKAGVIPVQLISPGWGSSGYYGAKVLENAAKAKVFAAGTQMFADHPGEAENYDRPERSIRDLAAVLTEDATWDGSALVAEAQVFGPWADLLTDQDFAGTIGVSIRAYADSTIGEAEGRKGQIITDLVEAISVDFVTKAGRGGRILTELMESARPAQVVERAIAQGVAEATANDTRDALSTALKDAYGGDKSWVWVRDFDEATVWYQYETPDGTGTYAEAFELDDQGVVTLSGSPEEVRAKTVYVPVKPTTESAPSVPAPAGQSTATKSEETNMATTQIEESRLAQLEKDAERVQSLESDLSTAQRERDEAREANAARDRRDAAVAVIAKEAKEANVTFTALEAKGLLAELPTSDDGKLDEAKFAEAVKTDAAAKATESGAGAVTGFGATHTESGAITAKESTASVLGAFGIPTSQEG